MDSTIVRRIAATALGASVITAGLGVTAPPASAATVTVSGVVVCGSGRAAQGIWVDSSAGGSGWAGWSPQPGAPHAAKYSRNVNSGGTVSLHIGCGGSRSSWASDNWTPRTGVNSSRTLNAVCNDTSGTGARCSFPSTGATRSTNTFDRGWCTDGAAQKFKQLVGSYPGWNGNAKDWGVNAQRAGWTVRAEPASRTIFVFQPGHGTNSSAGHVGYVDRIEYRSDGVYLYTTEMNARGWNTWSNEVRKAPANARYIRIP